MKAEHLPSHCAISPAPISCILYSPDAFFPVLPAYLGCCCFRLRSEYGPSVCFSLDANQQHSFYISQPCCRITRAKQHTWGLALIMPNSNCGCHTAASLSFWIFGGNKPENVVMQKLLQYLLCSSTVSIELQLEMHGKVLWGVGLGPWYL